MQLALVILHLGACIGLIIIVLLQTGKGSEIGAVFGSSSQTLFGSTGGSTFFGKLTTGVAVVFLLTSLILAGRANRYTTESIMTDVKPAATAPASVPVPTTPAPATDTTEETAAPTTKSETSGETSAPQETPVPIPSETEQKTD
jgi:preprotein translocase subunit SecG